MSGTLVISLDFELMWGVRDHRNASQYGDAILGGRSSIPKMLSRFRHFGVSATWATVGLLFARTRDEMLAYAPEIRPNYSAPRLSPYLAIESHEVGADEQDDPLHFGLSLINRIADTPGQEIATHTYSHYCCLESGQDVTTFKPEIDAAISIAHDRGYPLRSLVFPRNQKCSDHVQIAAAAGLGVYRGEAKGWLYLPRSGTQTTTQIRLMRFLDGAMPISGKQIVEVVKDGVATTVPASRFLRPWSRKLGVYNTLHIHRIQSEMKAAAECGGVYHLWWHPHNFGRNLDRNLVRMDRILKHYRYCRDNYGMKSCTMGELALPDNSEN